MEGSRKIALANAEIVITADGLGVIVDGVTHEARRAVSCLVEPKSGDRAIVARFGGKAFVLHVLQTSDGPVTLSSDRHLDVEIANGSFKVDARRVDLASGGPVRLAAGAMRARARTLRAGVAEAWLVARDLAASVDEIKSVGRLVERVAESTRRRFGRSIRRVEEDDRLEAGRVDITAKHEITLEAHDATITADTLTKADAKQVQVG